MSRLLENLRENNFPRDIFEVPSKSTIHTAFNYFKTVLCAESPNVFAYTQALEARVRLFAGMFWSAGFGVVVCSALGLMNMFNEKIIANQYLNS